jgi:hypothetical protein
MLIVKATQCGPDDAPAGQPKRAYGAGRVVGAISVAVSYAHICPSSRSARLRVNAASLTMICAL